MSISYNGKMSDKKKELFRNLEKFYPSKGSLRILEVGCGSGANFEHYPTGCKITCTDPNPHFQKYLNKSMAKNDHLVYDSFIVASGENLKAVEDNSVDVVVCTLVLCSVNDTQKVLQEAKRVLRPDQKKELFRNLEKFYLPKGSLRILEVGCGTGANFEHYPTGCKITCTDPNPHFQKYLDTTMAKNDHLVYDSFIVASGENLKVVEDNSVDVVVCTLVLCSVQDMSKVLQEAKRVLRPGGALFFIEHVVSDPSTWSYFFQHVIQPFW
ncbi:methyltransferase 7A [Labeo rohita]|uniref:Methyltransferase 7A n=1 Tax=Labeo rohita TaxID=84645 RepID=A0A498L8S6_LABRO|nr:methyltransferase 7A [Labeo rohita]RXN08034.1 methyltransferase 7A [Labeo rohita]